jgi:hypothetical protein
LTGSDLRALSRAVVAALADPAIEAAFASIVAGAVQEPAGRRPDENDRAWPRIRQPPLGWICPCALAQ